MANNSMLFEHTQRFMREVMADRLREEGFVSYKGEDIHWYRLVNNEVVQAIYFVTRHTAPEAIASAIESGRAIIATIIPAIISLINWLRV